MWPLNAAFGLLKEFISVFLCRGSVQKLLSGGKLVCFDLRKRRWNEWAGVAASEALSGRWCVCLSRSSPHSAAVCLPEAGLKSRRARRGDGVVAPPSSSQCTTLSGGHLPPDTCSVQRRRHGEHDPGAERAPRRYVSAGPSRSSAPFLSG